MRIIPDELAKITNLDDLYKYLDDNAGYNANDIKRKILFVLNGTCSIYKLDPLIRNQLLFIIYHNDVNFNKELSLLKKTCLEKHFVDSDYFMISYEDLIITNRRNIDKNYVKRSEHESVLARRDETITDLRNQIDYFNQNYINKSDIEGLKRIIEEFERNQALRTFETLQEQGEQLIQNLSQLNGEI